MSRIKLDVIKPWIQEKLTEILKIDDDVVVDFVYNQLDEKVRFIIDLCSICESFINLFEKITHFPYMFKYKIMTDYHSITDHKYHNK